MYGSTVRNTADNPLAKECAETLHQFYPGHLWHVFIGGGVLQVKNLNFSSKWGMVLKLKDIHSDAMVRKKKIIRAAGEFLERANIKRGARTDDVALKVEGIPQKDFGR